MMAKKQKTYTCGLQAAREVAGGKWKTLVLWPLTLAPACRFGELRRQVPGISEKMLIQQLKELEADGIVSRKNFQEMPPRVEYALTKFGLSLCEALEPLCRWGQQHMKRIQSCSKQKSKAPQKKNAT